MAFHGQRDACFESEVAVRVVLGKKIRIVISLKISKLNGRLLLARVEENRRRGEQYRSFWICITIGPSKNLDGAHLQVGGVFMECDIADNLG